MTRFGFAATSGQGRWRQPLRLALVLLAALLLAAACGGSQERPGDDPLAGQYIESQGSDTMVNLVAAWSEAYMGQFPGEIAATGGGSGTGIAAIINDTTDIAASSRAITPHERAQAAANDVEVWEWIVGQDGLAVAVHMDNPLVRLNAAQLKAIFTGEIRHWARLGWAEGGTINVYARQSNSGTYIFFRDQVLDGQDWAPGTRHLSGSSAINMALQTDTAAIGYYGVGYADRVRVLEIGASAHGPFYSPLVTAHVAGGDYALARPLYFYTNGAPSGLVLEFLRFVLAPAYGQALITAAGFYPAGGEHDAANQATAADAGIALHFARGER